MIEAFAAVLKPYMEDAETDLLKVWDDASQENLAVIGAEPIGTPSDFGRLSSQEPFTQEQYFSGDLFRLAAQYAENMDEYEACLKIISNSGATVYGTTEMWAAACIYYSWLFYEVQGDELLLKAGVSYFLKHRDEPSQFMEDILEAKGFHGTNLKLRMGHNKLLPDNKTFRTPYGNYLIYPIQLMHDLNAREENISVTIRYVPDPDQRIKSRYVDIDVPMSKLAKRDLIRYADQGLPVDADTHKLLAALLYDLIQYNQGDGLPFHHKARHIGWVEIQSQEGFIPYRANNAVYAYRDRYRQEYRAVASKAGSLDEWIDLFRPYRDEQHVNLRMIMAASFSSVLVRKMACPPYMLDIWGHTSGLGKTVALMAAASIWANPDQGAGYLKVFNSTSNALEQAAMFCCDLPLCVDELQTQQNTRSFDELIYRLCEGTGRSRATSTGGLREQYGWRNCIIATGEQPILSDSSLAGSMNRVIPVYCQQPLFTDSGSEINAFCNELRQQYGTAGRRFVQQLLQPEGMERAKALFDYFKKELAGRATSKQVMSGALILTADALADEWIFEDGLRLTVDQVASYLKKDEEISTNDRALEDIYEWIYANLREFEKSSGYKYGKKVRHRSTKRQYWAIRPDAFDLVTRAKKINAESFKMWAIENGIMIVDAGRKDYSVKIGGHNAHCICILFEEERTT